MNNLNDIQEFIETIEPGEPIYNISVYKGYSTEIQMDMIPWQKVNEMKESDCWIDQSIGRRLGRKFDRDTKEMQVVYKDSALDEVKSHIKNMVSRMILKTSPAEQPKRTKVYKELDEIAYRNRANDNFINDVLPILNYYYSKRDEITDKNNVHRKNVFGLLDILRKKYGTTSN